MSSMRKGSQPFVFYSCLHLRELTGLRADTIPELLEHIKTVPGSCIYHHTHHYLQQHRFLVPSANNDFSYWVAEVLGEDRLGEKLSSVDTVSAQSIANLRDQFIDVLEKDLAQRPVTANIRAPEGESFYFMRSKTFVFNTGLEANDLQDFVGCLRRASLASIYYHIFESRLRFEKPTNDFSNWITDSLDDKGLADDIAKLEPYTYSLEGLRRKLIDLCSKKFHEEQKSPSKKKAGKK